MVSAKCTLSHSFSPFPKLSAQHWEVMYLFMFRVPTGAISSTRSAKLCLSQALKATLAGTVDSHKLKNYCAGGLYGRMQTADSCIHAGGSSMT